MKEKSILILVQRDAKNIPFAKVLYNGQDAFELDNDAMFLAGHVARKALPKENYKDFVLVSAIDGTILVSSQIDLLSSGYYISGSVSGKDAAKKLISTVAFGASNMEIRVPVFVTDGKVEPIFINENKLSASYQKMDRALRAENEWKKQQLIESMIEEKNTFQGRTR